MNKSQLGPQEGKLLPASQAVEGTSSLVQAAVLSIGEKTHGAIRNLSVEQNGNTIVIGGSCDWYAELQLAQEAVKALPGSPLCKNEIVVKVHPKRP